jgi:hypothetical protein
VPPLVAATDLTMMSSDDKEVGQLMEESELGVSEALGISLSEVQVQYFRDSDKGEEMDLESERECECWLAKWAHERQLEYQLYREDAALE